MLVERTYGQEAWRDSQGNYISVESTMFSDEHQEKLHFSSGQPCTKHYWEISQGNECI